MAYILPTPFVNRQFEHFSFFSSFFTPEECALIIKMGEEKWREATTVGGDSTVKRRSEVAWLAWNPEQGWLWDKLSSAIVEANAQYFGFDLASMSEDLQLTRYEASNAGHYGWHQDVGGGVMALRKLSFVVQLSEPVDYEGGELELFMGQQDGHSTPPKGQGDIIFFPAYEPHRVTELTKGVRHSLVGWTTGPAFR